MKIGRNKLYWLHNVGFERRPATTNWTVRIYTARYEWKELMISREGILRMTLTNLRAWYALEFYKITHNKPQYN